MEMLQVLVEAGECDSLSFSLLISLSVCFAFQGTASNSQLCILRHAGVDLDVRNGFKDTALSLARTQVPQNA
eukprot:4369322-Prorocentrum_lima.AAC.1